MAYRSTRGWCAPSPRRSALDRPTRSIAACSRVRAAARASPAGPASGARPSHVSHLRRTTMPTFESPNPISITIDILGNTHITASDRTDTIITVVPRDPSNASDVKAAEHTVVDYSDGHLFVKSPRSWSPLSGSQTVVVTLEVPTGSALDGTSPMGDFHAEGELGTTKVKTSMGN